MELSFTARTVLLGATLLGAIGGAIGCFALLRRQSLLGDALAHTALPGVCLAYLVTGSKSQLPLLAGAAVVGLLGAFAIAGIARLSRLSEDAAIGIVLSVFFGCGIVLLTIIQRLPAGNQSGLDKFLFGQAAALLPRDVALLAVIGTAVALVLALFWKELELLCFDRDFGASLGFAMGRLEVVLLLVLVVVVVVGLQTVGVVLMVATLFTPAAAARQWTDRLRPMVLLAAALGAASGGAGALLSAGIARVPTGPVIVLVASAILVCSLLLAPGRGQLWSWLRHRRLEARIRQENLLKDLYLWGERHGSFDVVAPWAHLRGERGTSGPRMDRTARGLRGRSLLACDARGARLLALGIAAAEQVVRKHRLWELYLTRRLELPSDHVHRDAELMEHTLDEAAVLRLEQLLGYPGHDPHGRPIPRRSGAVAEHAG